MAATWGVLADEAYYALWAQHLAWGYYDQPPLMAWLLAATSWLAPGALGLRVGAVACGVIGALALVSVSNDRLLAAGWFLGVPSLLALTLFGTPDAPLLAAWAVCVAAACRGGRWWLLAGVAGAAALLSKYTGLAALPLCLLAAGPRQWRTVWPWAGLGLMGVLVLPHLVWSATHDWVALGFQLHEGLGAKTPPGLWGPVVLLRDQLGVTGPLVLAAGALWLWRDVPGAWRAWGSDDPSARLQRVASATVVGVSLVFLAASTLGVPEAHWPAPAALGLGLGAASASTGVRRMAAWGLGLGGFLACVIASHGLLRWAPIEADPADRLDEGERLMAAISTRLEAEPELPVLTERYQEAAWIEVLGSRRAWRWPGCGRADQFDLWEGAPMTQRAWFIRPATSGPVRCVEPTWRTATQVMAAGEWQLVLLERVDGRAP